MTDGDAEYTEGTDRFSRAVREGATLVEAGDRPRIAANYVADEYGIEHRREELLAGITDRVEAETEWLVTANQQSSSDALHASANCPNAPERVEKPTAEQIARLDSCDICRYGELPAIEDDNRGYTA